MEKYRDNIICVKSGLEDSQCPITDIKFVGGGEGNNEENTGNENTVQDKPKQATGSWIEYKMLDLYKYDVAGGFSVENYEKKGYTF